MNVYENREQEFINWLKKQIEQIDKIILEAQNKKAEFIEKLKEQGVEL